MTAALCRLTNRTRTAVPILAILLAIPVCHERAAASAPVEAGWRDFSYGTVITPAPTGEKPESKLWWNDGHWWGILWSVSASSYQIHRLDLSSQSWLSTGTSVDSRPGSKCDVLWDGQQLYVASHLYSTNPGTATSSSAARLYRYRYDPVLDSYTLDSGFPVLVNSSTSETLVLERDSTGKLWVTWMEQGKVKVNASSVDDRTWGQPFDLPVQGNSTLADDISSVVAMNGSIGIMWSNQGDQKMYFAVHLDGNADQAWEAREEALADASLGAVADDHINLKQSCGGDGALYGVVKTSLTGGNPGVYLLKRSTSGTWTRHVVGTASEGWTRPLLLLEHDENRVHVFATSTPPGPDNKQVIYTKSASMGDLQFPSGVGTAFIQSSLDTLVNDPTGTKQCLDASTGIAVLASARDTRFYLHQAIPGGSPPEPVAVAYEQGSTGGSVNSVDVSTTGSFREPGLYLAAVSSRPHLAAHSMSGLGFAWNRIASQCSGRSQTGVEIWWAQGTPTAEGVVTATYTNAPSSAVIAVSRYSGAAVSNPIGAVVSGNTMGIDGACGGGIDNASYSLPLSVSSSGAVAYGAVALRQAAHAPGEGYAERAEVHQGTSGAVAGLAVEDKSLASAQGVNVDGILGGSVDWAAVGIEILPADTVTGSEPPGGGSPQRVRLSNRPNPVLGETRIQYGTDRPGRVRLAIHDVAGRLVSTLIDEDLRAGAHSSAWDGKDSRGRALPRGVYFCRLETPADRQTIKILLIR